MASIKSTTLPGHGLIDPLQQGELDALCGLYAIINAFRLVYAPSKPLYRRETELLFAEGVDHLKHLGLIECVAKTGMLEAHQADLADHLKTAMAEQLKRPVVVKPLAFTLENYCSAIRTALEAGSPVCALFSGALDHYTVISGMTETRFQFFDSSGFSWVPRSGCQLSGGHKNARHRIKWHSLFTTGLPA